MAWEVLTAPWHSWLSPQLKRNLSLFNIASMYKQYKSCVLTLLLWGMFPGNRSKKSFHHIAPESIGIIWNLTYRDNAVFLKQSVFQALMRITPSRESSPINSTQICLHLRACMSIFPGLEASKAPSHRCDLLRSDQCLWERCHAVGSGPGEL